MPKWMNTHHFTDLCWIDVKHMGDQIESDPVE